MIRLTLQAVRTAALSMVFVVVMAAPALADAVGPTNYRSVVNVLEPHPSGVTVTVVGGDGYLAVAVAEGHTVAVPGYFGEPYLRVDADGTVWRNDRSPARYINRDRYGTFGVPDEADASAEPSWVRVGDGGTFAWHDHRIHWMSPDLPPSISGDRAEIVFPWRLEMVIDGTETEVRGELLWLPSVNPVGPLLSGVIVVLLFLGVQRGRLRPVPHVVIGVGAMTLLVANAQFAATPALDRGLPTVATLPGIAIMLAVGALWIAEPSRATWAIVAISGAALVGWSVLASRALTAPILPSALPTFAERASISVAAWVGIATIGIAVAEILFPRTPAPGEDQHHDIRVPASI